MDTYLNMSKIKGFSSTVPKKSKYEYYLPVLKYVQKFKICVNLHKPNYIII